MKNKTAVVMGVDAWKGMASVSAVFFVLGIALSGIMFWVEDVNFYPIDRLNVVLSMLIIFAYGLGLYLGMKDFSSG